MLLVETIADQACTGLEDNVRLDKDTLAQSNAALVRWAAEVC